MWLGKCHRSLRRHSGGQHMGVISLWEPAFFDRYPKSLRPGIDTVVRKLKTFCFSVCGWREAAPPVEAFRPRVHSRHRASPCCLSPIRVLFPTDPFTCSPLLVPSTTHKTSTHTCGLHPPAPPPLHPSLLRLWPSVRRRAPRWRKYWRVLVVSSNSFSPPPHNSLIHASPCVSWFHNSLCITPCVTWPNIPPGNVFKRCDMFMWGFFWCCDLRLSKVCGSVVLSPPPPQGCFNQIEPQFLGCDWMSWHGNVLRVQPLVFHQYSLTAAAVVHKTNK